ncbi:MAG: hypothetical protein JWR24_5310 [Actinoallomurus sp.]|nr:hypothetical protein [Actinoallomurus sp.]
MSQKTRAPTYTRRPLSDWDHPLASAARACCCPAWPAVTVVIPASPDRPRPADLLLCAHHYRVSREAVARVGATVYDASGVVIALPRAPAGGEGRPPA